MSIAGIAASSEVEQFVRELGSAIAEAGTHIQGANLRVTEVAFEIKTTAVKNLHGELDLKVVKAGFSLQGQKVSTVGVTFAPATAEGFVDAGPDRELVRTLASIEAAVSGMGRQFTLSSAVVEIGILKTVEGKLQVLLGGDVSRADVHTARLKFEPAARK